MQWRWCALHRIILNKVTASIVFRCMSRQINGLKVYHILGYFYEQVHMQVRFITLKYNNNKIMHKQS